MFLIHIIMCIFGLAILIIIITTVVFSVKDNNLEISPFLEKLRIKKQRSGGKNSQDSDKSHKTDSSADLNEEKKPDSASITGNTASSKEDIDTPSNTDTEASNVDTGNMNADAGVISDENINITDDNNEESDNDSDSEEDE